jgi:IS605 OrfB family transposase
MKLVANIKLQPTPEQFQALKETLECCNKACDYLSAKGFEAGILRTFDLHKLGYADIRERFGLAAQVAVRCIAKTADAYKLDKKVKRSFRKHAAQPYDDRIVSFKPRDIVSIWTLGGRIKVQSVMGKRQRELLAFRKGEVDLMLVRGEFYLACVCDIDEADPILTTKVLGVDLGIVNIATDSDGKMHSGAAVEATRQCLSNRRKGLQRCGSKAAKRRLRILSGKQRRFQTHTNHCISKAIVVEAQRSGRGIGLEDLKHIRTRVKARRSHRARLGNWSFWQLQAFVAYKAKRAGIPVLLVDPRHTSQGCSSCGTIDKKNRPDQATFFCVSCGHAEVADINAARNIKSRAEAALCNPALSSQAAQLAA